MKYVFIIFVVLMFSFSNCEIKEKRFDDRSDTDSVVFKPSLIESDRKTEEVDSIINLFREKKYTLSFRKDYDSTDVFLRYFQEITGFQKSNIVDFTHFSFVRSIPDKHKPKILVSQYIFNEDSLLVGFIEATNNLLEKEPINYKGSSFYTKKGNVLYTFGTNAFMDLIHVKIMKALCDSLVIQPDTADIRMANECIYNQRMDTYYKTRPWREEMKNY